MAYEKQTWTTGDVITQEKLNHMEQGIEDGVNGYECTETTEELFEETVDTGEYRQANLEYSMPITATPLRVTFDGTVYTCPRIDMEGGYAFYGGFNGGMDYSEFPFAIQSLNGSNTIFTEESGEHTVKAEVAELSVTTTPCFEAAVNAAYDGVEIVDIIQTGTGATQSTPIINFSYDDLGQILQKYNNGKAVVRLQLLPNPSLNYYMGGEPRLYVDAFYATSSSMTGDYYALHAHSTSVYNVSAHAIRIYDITLEVGRFSNRLAIEAIQVSPEQS